MNASLREDQKPLPSHSQYFKNQNTSHAIIPIPSTTVADAATNAANLAPTFKAILGPAFIAVLLTNLNMPFITFLVGKYLAIHLADFSIRLTSLPTKGTPLTLLTILLNIPTSFCPKLVAFSPAGKSLVGEPALLNAFIPFTPAEPILPAPLKRASPALTIPEPGINLPAVPNALRPVWPITFSAPLAINFLPALYAIPAPIAPAA